MNNGPTNATILAIILTLNTRVPASKRIEMVTRNDPNLKLNHAALDLHIGNNRNRENKKYYDDVILATTYIGPIAKK